MRLNCFDLSKGNSWRRWWKCLPDLNDPCLGSSGALLLCCIGSLGDFCTKYKLILCLDAAENLLFLELLGAACVTSLQHTVLDTVAKGS